MAAVLPIALGAGSFLGGFLGGGDQTQSVARNPADAALAQLLRRQLTARMRGPVVTGGLKASGVQNINRAFSPIEQTLRNSLTARGLSTSPVAGLAEGNLQIARGASIADFLNQVPMIERDLRNQDFSQVANFVNAQPVTTLSGNRVGSGAQSVTTLLAYLAGSGALGGGN
jgi:hypothetical protein